VRVSPAVEEDAADPRIEALYGEEVVRAFPARVSHATTELLVAEQRAKRTEQLLCVVRIDDEAGLAVDDDLASGVEPARNARKAVRHGFGKDETEPLAAARHRVDVRAGVPRGELGVGDLARESHARADPERFGLSSKLFGAVAAAHDAQFGAGIVRDDLGP
jgi:hypothetical protein